MSSKSKLTLLLELKNKLFNNKLSATKNKFNNATNEMGNKLGRFKNKHLAAFSAMREESALFGRAMDLMGNPYALIAAGLLALGVIFGKAYGEAKRFNYEFLQIQQLNLDKPKAELAQYKELVRDSAFATGKSATETAKGYYDLQSALGVYGNEAKTIFTQVANYSTATGAELTDSINSTTKAMKAFNLGAKDTKMLLQSNAKTVQTGIVSYKELAKVQTEYAGAAAGAGQSVDTANKLFAIFTSIAKDANVGANMTKTAFEGLTQAGTVKGLKSIGIELYTAEGKMRNLDKVLGDVSTKFQSMTPKQIDELINKIGGPEGLRNLFTKLKTNSADFFKTIETFDSSKFDLDQALKNAQGDVTALSNIVGNQFNTIMARLGDVILPAVVLGLDGISKLLKLVYDNWDDISTVLLSVSAGIGTYLGALATLKIISIGSTLATIGLSGALAGVQMAIRAVGTAIYNIPIIGWIAAAVAGLILLYNKWDWFRELVDNIGGGLATFFSGLWDGAKKVIGGIADQFIGLGKIIQGIWDFDSDRISEGAAQLKNGFKKQFTGGMEIVMQPVIAGTKKPEKIIAKVGKGNAGTFGPNAEPDLLTQRMLASEQENEEKNKTTNGTGTGEAISNVTGSAGQVKNITVNIEAFNKGGINTSNTTLANKTAKEMEEWFNEAMMRTIRGVEMS